MPFVTQQRREAMSLGGAPETVGDLCYLAYQQMLGLWRANRRWTTAHDIKKEILGERFVAVLMLRPKASAFSWADYTTAVQLAWEVFFHREVMNYEEEQAGKNGEI